MAPGLRGKVVVEFSAKHAGSLTALISIESSDQVCEIPVLGAVSDGFEKFDEILQQLPMPDRDEAASADSLSLLSGLKYTQRQKEKVVKRGEKGSKTREIKTISSDDGGWFGETR